MDQSIATKIRKEAILDTAQELFQTFGFEKTSISKIASSMDIAKGLLYYYFATKDEILQSVVERMCAHQISALEAKLDNSKVNFYEALVLLLLEYRAFRARALSARSIYEQESRLTSEFHHCYLTQMHEVIHRITDMGVEASALTIDAPHEMVLMVFEGVYRLDFYQREPIDVKLSLIETALHLKPGILKQSAGSLLSDLVIEERGDTVCTT